MSITGPSGFYGIYDVILTAQEAGFSGEVPTPQGVVIPVIDLRTRFGVEIDAELDRFNKLIIVSVRGRIVSLKVDSVVGELRVPTDEVRPAPSMLSSPGEQEFFSGVCKIGEEVVFVVNVDGLIGGGE